MAFLESHGKTLSKPELDDVRPRIISSLESIDIRNWQHCKSRQNPEQNLAKDFVHVPTFETIEIFI